MEFDEEIREFLIESNENLANLDREILQLEQNPGDMQLISSAFRTIHTIKGTCGFFGYSILGSVTHIAENILSQVREGQRVMTPALISLILATVDQVKMLLQVIEATGAEGEDHTGPLRARLEQAHRECGNEAEAVHAAAPVAAAAPPVAAPTPVAVPAPQAAAPAHKEPHLLTIVEVPPPAPVHVPAPVALAAPAPVAPPAPVAAPAKAPAEAKDANANLSDSTIRVDVALLNRLMNLVGELVLARNQLLQDSSAQNPSLQQTSQRLNLITSELQEGVMKTRMQPIGVVWNKLPRVVRDLASQVGKRIQIDMEGAGTELDKTIIEAIKDPLTHIVRNSCDHGIETPDVRLKKGKKAEGTLIMRAYHEGGVVNIEITDDGAGIDPERVKAKAVEKGLIRPEQAATMSVRDALHLIFLPGFSTAASITSISGRGVGMDVVKTNIEKIGGSVQVQNRTEGGTTIRIKIPLTLAIIPGLVVTLDHSGGQTATHRAQDEGPLWKKEERFIIPQANLLELVHLEGEEEMRRIENVHSTPIFHHRGKLLPLVYLGRVLGRTTPPHSPDSVNIVVLQAENRQMGLVVDRICDTQEIVVKPLGRQLKGLICYVGATIMGDGRPALILDVAGLSRLAGLSLQSRASVSAAAPVDGSSQPQMMLLFRAGRYDRLAVPLVLVDRLEEVDRSKVERAAGRAVLHYRNQILPLVSLSAVLDPGSPDTALDSETAQIVVFTDGVQRIGLVVEQILDIVNEAVTVRRRTTAPGLLGSAVIGGKITDLIDLHALAASAGENWLDPSRRVVAARHRVLLLDANPVAREMIHEFLNFSGYEVTQAATLADALAKLPSMQAVIAAVGFGAELVAAMRQDQMLEHIPVVGLLDRHEQMDFVGKMPHTFDAKVVRSERDSLLRALGELTQASERRTEVAA